VTAEHWALERRLDLIDWMLWRRGTLALAAAGTSRDDLTTEDWRRIVAGCFG